MSKLTQDRLKSLLHYSSDTGVFTWRVQVSARIYVGAVAGKQDASGYLVIGIDRKSYLAHRLAWLYVYGYMPENGLDHKDQVRHHNWIDNLREASQVCNLRNTGNRKDNSSGVKGVIWHRQNQKWQAQIMVNGKMKYLGTYVEYVNAVCARLAGEQCLDWSGCDCSSPAFIYIKNNVNANVG